MKPLDATEVSRLLIEIGQRAELAGENPYKARAYYRAAESLTALTMPLGEVIATDRLRDIPGVGAAIADVISRLHKTGSDPKLQTMRGDVPVGVLEMLRIPRLRPEKIRAIHEQLGIASLDELEAACRENRLAACKGLGAAVQKNVLQGIELMRRSQGQRLIHRAAELLRAAEANLKRSHPELTRIAAAGDFRRGCELVGGLALVAETPEPKRGGVVQLNPEIQLHLADHQRYGPRLLFATGSEDHWRQLQAFAAERGFTIDENGLRRGRRLVPCADEAAVYAVLGLPFVEPELREGLGEIALAASGRLPKLVTDTDIRGLLHCHTDFSDGANTLEEMAEATRERGYQYLGIADHSQSARYAGGLTVEKVEAQLATADKLNQRYRGAFRIFKGIESDILEDGSLDYPDEVLRGFDYVVASVHSQFRLDEKAQTARIIRAVSNPHATILGHMTGACC
jgi:DNA polymerase (family 10)